jgi:hypothetical protein
MQTKLNRRHFIKRSVSAGFALTAMGPISSCLIDDRKGMKFGLVTYLWGQDWDLPTLITNCEKASWKGSTLVE